MFNEIDELQDMATAAENEFSDQQIVNLGIHLIKNTGDFEKGITEWYEATTTKDWISFKSHFEKAQNILRKVRGPTMKSGILAHQANAISSHIMENLQNERAEYLNAVSAAENRILNALGSSTPKIIDEQPPPVQPAANSTTTSDAIMLEVLKLLKDIKKEPSKTEDSQKGKRNWCERKEEQKRAKQTRENNDSQPQHSNDERRRYNKYKREKATNLFNHYCWSCGAASHPSKDCNNRKDGHKIAASFKNMMGGCTDFCQVIN